MKYIFDTNVLIHLMRNSATWQFINDKYQPFAQGKQVFLSFASVAEVLSIAEQANWGQTKKNELMELFGEFEIIAISNDTEDLLLQNYVQIDSFSQGKNTNFPLPKGMSARNMGKNDIWIAATACALEATLITTDNDFLHLSPTFIEIEFVEPL